MQGWQLFLISTLYVAALFAVASYGDRAAAGREPARKPWTYSLALCVYCTSWTFYGAVGRAASSGWDFLPIYLGPMLLFVFGLGLIRRVVRISKRHNLTSIADFVGARYGRRQSLPTLVTVIAVIGVLPYIALQLKAIATSFGVLAPGMARSGGLPDTTLLMALMLGAFAILFGTRHVASSENHHGMVLAIAFESLVKLLAFLAVGLYAAYGHFNGLGDAYAAANALPQVSQLPAQPAWQAGFAMQTLLAAAAMLCLPRQFHVAVVENTDIEDLRAARWIFPTYIALISLFVLPIAAAGLAKLPGVSADTFVLALPLRDGHSALALFAYIGGFSAATSMVIVSSIALATMVSNEIVLPRLLRRPEFAQLAEVGTLIKTTRRIAIIAIVLLAYLYYRWFAAPGSLASIGLLSFSAVIQFAPALVGGIFSRRASFVGAVAGLSIGFALWAYTLLLPTLLQGNDSAILRDGLFGIAALRPTALFGVGGLDLVTHGTLWSLLANIACYGLVSWLSTPGLRERLQAVRFVEEAEGPSLPQRALPVGATVGDLQELLERFFGKERAEELLTEYAQSRGRRPQPQERAEPTLAREVERWLAGALGAAGARLVLASTLRGRDMQPEDVIRLLDDTSHAILFNREQLRASLEHLSQGVSVVDAELKLVAWNSRYSELFAYPPELVRVGQPIETLMRYNAGRGLLGSGDLEAQIARRLALMREGHAYTHERELPDGTVLEIRGNPMPGGGFVTSYSDVTAYKRTQRALQEINETLETRVDDRTHELSVANAELSKAKAAAETAYAAKTRFLAAASHDLAQPLSAARLFLASVEREPLSATASATVSQAGQALASAENLISTLLDISRLDARAESPRLEHFRLSSLLQPLAAEFAALAREQGLQLRLVDSSRVVQSDPRLLRRVLQNFLSNALRYTRRGRVLLGCRRAGNEIRIEVWDTGPGIAAEKQQEIFEEFRRLDLDETRGARGLGLGLAIADRIARILEHPLSLRSRPGRGSVFAITVPLGDAARVAAPRPAPMAGHDRLEGARVLCLDNEPAVLAGLESLLSGWGCIVLAARDAAQARAAGDGRIPDLMLIDYHLDGGSNGVEVAAGLRSAWRRDVPGIVITADHTPRARVEAQEHNFALLPKPVRPAALRALMNRVLTQR